MKYTDSKLYDQRTQHPAEKYIHSIWDPILRQTIEKYIDMHTTVCDLGCGTLEHTQYMSKAAHIIAVDSSLAMVQGGEHKVTHIKSKLNVVVEDALHTSIPNHTCDIVWSVGLSEYVDLEELWQEISRLSTNTGTVIIQFPNTYSPYNLIITAVKRLLGQEVKQFRTLKEMDTAAHALGWQRHSFVSRGMILPLPTLLAPLGLHLWPLYENVLAPIQAHYPLGLNVLAMYQRGPDKGHPKEPKSYL